MFNERVQVSSYTAPKNRGHSRFLKRPIDRPTDRPGTTNVLLYFIVDNRSISIATNTLLLPESLYSDSFTAISCTTRFTWHLAHDSSSKRVRTTEPALLFNIIFGSLRIYERGRWSTENNYCGSLLAVKTAAFVCRVFCISCSNMVRAYISSSTLILHPTRPLRVSPGCVLV